MSRSYRKHLVLKNKHKGYKKIANKSLRQKLKQIDYEPNYGNYKKIYNSWNLESFKSIYNINNENLVEKYKFKSK